MRRLALVLLVAACGGAQAAATTPITQTTPAAQTATVPFASSSAAPAPASYALDIRPSRARRLAPPPSGCRPLVARAMPHPSIVHAWVPLPTRTTTLVAADRLIVFQTEDGVPERGEMFDPASDTWIPISSLDAPRYGSFKDGPGPVGGHEYFAFEDWVVVTWFDGNHYKHFSGAVFDARNNRWQKMNTEGAQLEEAIEAGSAGVYVRLRRKGADAGYRYDIRSDRWSAIPSTNAARSYPAVAASGGKVVVWSGILGENPGMGSVLDLATNTWKPMSAAAAPSGRMVSWSAQRDGRLVVWSGTSVRGQSPDLRDGGIYDVAADRWTPISATNAPDDPAEDADRVFVDWTGEALVVRELPKGAPARSDPRRLAFWDPQLGAWWRSSVATTWPLHVLGFGRVLSMEGPSRVVHAHEKLDCPVKVPALPIFAKGASNFKATVLIGDELVVWGRVDSPPAPPCPPGAPCARFVPVFTTVDDGAVISP